MSHRAKTRRKKHPEELLLAWEVALLEEERLTISIGLSLQLIVIEKTYGIGNPEIKNFYLDYYLINNKDSKVIYIL